MGGLGVKDIYSLNFALLAKCRWYLFNNRGYLWNRVLESKYSRWREMSDRGTIGLWSLFGGGT